MSDVDKRVVQMDFDNKKFEKNVKQSTQSLNALKTSLNFDGVSDSIDQVSVKISRMEYVAAAAITNITNRIVNLGIQMIKSLSIDNIAAGWTKFGQKTISIATLMAQTLKVNGKALEDNVEKLSTVNALMEKLIWFSDETSYTFTDMVDNASKFIAAGLDLDVSVKAMEGIATWAALSGQNASTAARAMYQLSQAMGKGKIQLIDWKSIQTANMDTAQFRQNVLETAVAMGQLTKEGDKFVTKTGKKFTQNQFTEQLSSGWFTSEVLTKTLEKYSGAADEIYALAKKEGKTASEIIAEYGDTLDEFGVKAFKAAQEARTLSDALTSVKDAVASKWMTTSELIFGDKDEAVQLWTDLANELYEVFAESGNFRNEILKVWKALEGRADLFSKGGDDQGAFWNIYDAIIAVKKVIKDAWNTIFPITQMEEDSDKAQEIGNAIKRITSRFKEWTKTLKLSEVNAVRLRKALEGVFSIFKGLLVVLKAVKYILGPIVDMIKKLLAAGLDKIIEIVGKFNITGEGLIKVSNKIHDGLENVLETVSDFVKEYVSIEKIKTAFTRLRQEFAKLIPILNQIKAAFIAFGNTIKNAAESAIGAIKELLNIGNGKNVDSVVVKPLKKSLSSFSSVAEEVVETGENASSNVSSKTGLLWAIADLFKALYELISSIVSLTASIIFLINRGIKNLAEIIKSVADGVQIVSGVTDAAEETSNNLDDWKRYMDGWQGTLVLILAISAAVLVTVMLIRSIYYSIQAVVAPISQVCESLAGYLDNMAISSLLKALGTVALEFAATLVLISSIDPGRLWPAVLVLGIISAILAGIVVAVGFIYKSINKTSTTLSAVLNRTQTIYGAIVECVGEVRSIISETKKLLAINAIIRVLQAFGTAMMQVALALYVMAQIEPDRLWAGLGVIAAVTVLVIALSRFSKKCETEVKKALPGMGQMIVLAVMVRSLANSLLMFKNITDDQRINIIIAFGVMSTFLGLALGFLTGLTKISSSGNIYKSQKTIYMLSGMSSLLFIFALSTKMLTSVPWNTLVVTFSIISGFIGAFAGLIFAIKGSAKIFVNDSWASIYQMLAMSLLLFSFGITAKILATIPWGTMGVVLGVIGAFFAEFAGLMMLLGVAANLGSNGLIEDSINVLLAMSLAIFSFGISAKLLASIPWNTLGVTLGVVGAFFGEFAGLIIAINFATKLGGGTTLEKCEKLVVSMSLVLISFGIMARLINGVDYGKLWSAIGGLVLVIHMLGEMLVAVGFVTKLGLSAKEGMGLLISVSGLLLSFAVSVALLSLIDTAKMFISLAGIAAMMGVFVGIAVTLGRVPGAIEGAKSSADALKQFAISLAITAASLFVLAIMPWDRVLTAAGAIAIVIGSFAGLAVVLGSVKGALDAMIKFSKSFLIFSISLVAVGGALTLVATQPWEQILAAAGAIVAVVSTLAGAVALFKLLGVSGQEFLQDTIAMSLGLTLFSGAIVVFAAAIKMFESIDWMTIVKALGAVAIQIGVLALAAAITKTIIPAILALASAFLLIGMGMILSAAAIQMVINAITMLGTISSEQMSAIKDRLSEFVTMIGETLSPLVSSFLEALAANIPTIFTIVKEVVHGIISLLGEELPNLITTIVDAITTLIDKLAETSGTIYKDLKTMIDGLLTMLQDNAAIWGGQIVDVVLDIVDVLTKKENVDRIVESMFTFVNNLLDAIINNEPMLQEIIQKTFALISWLMVELTKNAVKLAGDVAKVTLVVIAAAIQIVIASLGSLSRLFMTFVASILLILAYTVSGLGNIIFEVFKVVIKEFIKGFVKAMIYFQDIMVALGMVIGQLLARGLILAAKTWLSWLWDFIWVLTGGTVDMNKKLQEAADNMGKGAQDVANNLDGSIEQVQQAIKDASTNINNVVKMTVEETNSAVADGLSQISDAVTTAQRTLGEQFKDLGISAGTGYQQGIEESTLKANESSRNMSGSSIDASADEQKSNSPSKRFAELGMWAVLGYAQGISNNTDIATDGMTSMVSQALTAAQDTLDNQNGDDLTIKVGMDISGVEEQSRNISSIMSGINNVTATAYGRNASYNSAAMNKGTSGESVINTDNSTAVTYNNVFNVTSTDPEKSADEIDRALNRQAMMAKLAHGGV